MAEKGMFNPIRTIGGKKYQMVGHGYDAKKDAEYMAKQYKRLVLYGYSCFTSEFHSWLNRICYIPIGGGGVV